jgi:hypothetical protein
MTPSSNAGSGVVGKRVLGTELAKTAKAIETRNDGARAAEVT